jgi:hypothetical protein
MNDATTTSGYCGWCKNRINEFAVSNENHSAINITWGCGRIAWSDAYALRDLVKEYYLKEVLEFGTGLSTEIFAILGLKIVTCDTLENHSKLFSELQSLNGIADVIYYESGTLPDFEKLYPGKKWELVFVDGGQGRDMETEIAMKLASKLIYLHDPGLSKYGLGLPGWEQIGGSYLFKKKDDTESISS